MSENTKQTDVQRIAGLCDGLRKSRTTRKDAEAMLEVNTIGGYRNLYGEAAKKYLDELDEENELELTDPGRDIHTGFVFIDEDALEEVPDDDLGEISAEELAEEPGESTYTVEYIEDDEEE